jgi:cation transport regulator
VREATEGKPEAFEAGRRPGGFAESSWWLVAKKGTGGLEPLVVGDGEERAFAVFGYEEEASMFLLLGDLEGDGWRVRQSGAGEIVSLLCGPCADIGSVALDPLPGKAADGTLGLVCVAREGFPGRLLDGWSTRSRRAVDVKNNLRGQAQEIYKEALNSAEDQYSEEGRAHRVVRSAVEQKNEKENWVQKKTDPEIEKGERSPFSRT